MAKEPTLGTEHLLTFERADSPADAVESLSQVLASEFDEAPTAPDEPAPEPEAEADSEGEPEEEEVEASDEGESEDEEESDDQSEEPEAPPVYRVKVDGEELEVPLDELLKGYSRTADYTRKTTEVANQRKALETEVVGVRAVREQYEQGLGIIADVLKEQLPPAPDEKLRQENPGEYAARKQERAEAEANLEVVLGAQQRTAAEREEEAHKAYLRDLEEARKRLPEVIPEWTDAKRATEEGAKVVAYAERFGWSPQKMAGITDPGLVAVIRKAMLYDEIQTKGKEKIREKAKAAPVLQPGGRTQAPRKGPQKEQQARLNRAQQTGRVQDAAHALEGLLD